MRSSLGSHRGVVALGALLLGLPLLTYGGVEATSTAALCQSCHEIEPAVASFERSPHAKDPKTGQNRATCRDCHVPSWDNPLAAVWGKLSHGARDLYVHLATPEAAAAPDFYFALKGRLLMNASDEACLDCHAEIRGAKDTIDTADGKLVGLHASPEARRVACIVCHKNTGHDLYD
jgi:cytochrome c-type protein NapC/trimethylamine-N-oxide reductase cytochrome c-type subunit TorC